MTALLTGSRRRLIEAMRGVPPGWIVGLAGLTGVIMLPVATTLLLALTTSDGSWQHLAQTVLPRTLRDTLVVMAGTCLLTLVIGAGTAWLVTMYRFPARALLDRLLVLPLAVPAYILAYTWVEALDFAGPVQSAMRQVFGWQSARDYWFPELRSRGGAIAVLSFALYPYVYLSARASFVQQSVCVLEVARTLGQTSIGAFRTVALPLARPALAAGIALVAMECLNDFGAMQYLGVETLSVAIYSTWLQRGSLGGAAQIAVIALTLVLALAMAERRSRDGQTFHHTTGRYRSLPFQELRGVYAGLAIAACLAPVLFGFILPFGLLAKHALSHLNQALASGFWTAALSSLLLASVTALATLAIGLILAFAVRAFKSRLVSGAATLAGLGYALPGTVLALGLMIPLAGVDRVVDTVVRALTGYSSGPLLSGSILIVVIALTIRFLAVSIGAIDAGFKKVSPNLDAAARTLGETQASLLWRVHLPMLAPAFGTAALLVFVDAMKELPATLLLRPFNFETLATHVYSLAALEQFEAAALGALAIVLVGLLPTWWLHRTVAGGRAGVASK